MAGDPKVCGADRLMRHCHPVRKPNDKGAKKGRERSWYQDVGTRGVPPRRLFMLRSEQESHRYCGDRQKYA